MLDKLEKLKEIISKMTPEEFVELFEKHKVDGDAAKCYAFLEKTLLKEEENDEI